jgi:hypothetical protein
VAAHDQKFTDRVKKAVGGAVEQPSRLGHHFANLNDEQAMALGGIMKAAAEEIKPLVTSRNETQQKIATRVESLAREIVDKNLLKQDRAEALVRDMLDQLEGRASAHASKATARSA